MITGFFNITLQGKVLLFFLFSIIFILFTYFFYKYTIPKITFYKKLILSLLRGIVLILLILLIYEPILSIVTIIKEKPKIGILFDNTQSILISKNSNNQLLRLKEFFDSKKLENRYPEVSFKYYSFQNNVVEYNQFFFDSLKFDGEVTDISAALKGMKNKDFKSLVLVTDGNYNSGRNPIYEVEELNIPIYVVGIGDTIQQRDVMIAKVHTNNIVYSGSRVPIEVTLRWFGFRDENAELILSEDKSIISQSVIKLNEGENEKRFELIYDANNAGVRKLNVKVSYFNDEITEKNNFKDFYIEVLKSKLKIVVISGAPSPDVSTTFNTLIENNNYYVMNFVQKNSEEFYPFYRDGKYVVNYHENILDTIDCIVLINYPTKISKVNTLTKIINKIQERKIPLLIILGKGVDYTKLQLFDPILPFKWQSYNEREVYVFPRIDEKTSESIIYSKYLTQESYQQLPPIYRSAMLYRAKAESKVIASTRQQNLEIDEPMFINRNINRQKTFAILGYGIWRWKILTQGTKNEKFLYNFLTAIINWLTVIEDKQKIIVMPVKKNFTNMDLIEFTGQVYNEQYQSIDDAIIKVNISSKDMNYELLMSNIGNGRYEGRIENMKTGDYEYTAKVEVNGINIGELKGKFAVGNINLEYLDTRMNIQLLKRISLQSEGIYYDIDSIDELVNALSGVKLETIESEVVSEIKLWIQEFIGGIIIIIFIIEWIIRKRSGLL